MKFIEKSKFFFLGGGVRNQQNLSYRELKRIKS